MDDEGTDAEDVLERQLSAAVRMNLFDEQPPYLNAFFRFQLGSNTFDGYEFAMEAWKRVASVGATSVGNGAMHGAGEEQSLDSLRRQKDAVKRELKLFDAHFTKFYGRQPSRLDKECLRKLYEFHKQLKAYIAAEEVKLERRNTQQQPAAAASANQHEAPTAAQQRPPPPPQHMSGQGQASAQEGGPEPPPKAPDPVQLQEMDLKVLKAEKRALKIKLRRFEDEFIRQHGQKPQSYQEVGAIREDYSRYKLLKEALQSAEQQGLLAMSRSASRLSPGGNGAGQ
mmetsp:Transcript_42358/g.100665  ORF Transcript_42358/g.100665 Transcript_42358/m.100665 type:complete len:283 (-) Transcript_42358:68-916(-)